MADSRKCQNPGFREFADIAIPQSPWISGSGVLRVSRNRRFFEIGGFVDASGFRNPRIRGYRDSVVSRASRISGILSTLELAASR